MKILILLHTMDFHIHLKWGGGNALKTIFVDSPSMKRVISTLPNQLGIILVHLAGNLLSVFGPRVLNQLVNMPRGQL
jgi:hypothetical protein